MGCCGSSNGLNHIEIKSDIVLEIRGDDVRYHGTTERGRFQVKNSFQRHFLCYIL